MIDSTKSIEACAAYYGDAANAMKNYLIEARIELRLSFV